MFQRGPKNKNTSVWVAVHNGNKKPVTKVGGIRNMETLKIFNEQSLNLFRFPYEPNVSVVFISERKSFCGSVYTEKGYRAKN